MSDETMLPEKFADLEPWAATWSLPRERERYDQRLASTMDELQAFYDAMVPRAEEALDYLDQFAVDDLDPQQLNLLWTLLSLSAVSFAIDCFGQPKVPAVGGSEHIPFTVEPVP